MSSICDFWIPAKGYEGYLMVSASGDLHSLDRYVQRSDTGRSVLYKGVPIKSQLDKRGYPQVRLSMGGVKRTTRVHRLVALSFIQNPDGKVQVNHIDGDKENNCLSNLEWSTNYENQKHAIETGLKVFKKGACASRFECVTSVFKDGIHIYDVSGNLEMAEKGFDYRLVSAVVLGKRKTHKGHTFTRNKQEIV